MQAATYVVALGITLASIAGQDTNSAGGCASQPGSRQMVLPVRVMTKHLQAIDGLKEGDFTLTENGTPRKICGFTHVTVPVSIGILLDASGSMRGASTDLFKLARVAINQLLDASIPEDEYFLELVNEVPSMRCSFTSSAALIRTKLDVKPSGRTALTDAVYLAVTAMRKARYLNRALIVVSDGGDNESVYSLKELEAALAASPVPIFLIIPIETFPARSQSLEQLIFAPGFIEIVNRSGGYTSAVRSPQEVTSTTTDLISNLRRPYLLRFVSPAPPSQEKLDLRVTVKGVSPPPVIAFKGAFSVPPTR